jgi:aspartyl aminopeptidase
MPAAKPQPSVNENPTARGLLNYIDASPSPWHAVATAQKQLHDAGYKLLDERETWKLKPGGRYVVARDDAALIAFVVGKSTAEAGFRIVGAHTDSPCLRVKTQGASVAGGYLRLATEVYGSPILATYTDRDLLLAGRVIVRDTKAPDGLRTVLVRLDDALVRLPNLPIHMNRTVNDDGLKVHKHTGLTLLLAAIGADQNAAKVFADFLADAAAVAPSDVLGFDLCAVDGQPGAFFGQNKEFIAVRALDNLASCHAAMLALTDVAVAQHTSMIALFDHEEVGSESRTGAAGTFMQEVMARILARKNAEVDTMARAVANSWHLSADMAHAHHPSHPECYDPLHALKVNAGVALKINASQRYATNASGEAFVAELARKAGVNLQKYVHRADLACGSTIGPISAARLGLRTVDIGAPMWAMHSCRESAGALDQEPYIKLMQQFFAK